MKRLLVARYADETDVGVRQQLLRGVNETEPGTKHRYHDGLRRQGATGRGDEGRGDAYLVCRQTSSCLGDQQGADPLELLAEQGVGCVLVAHTSQGISDQWVLDEVHSDGHIPSVSDLGAKVFFDFGL